MCPQSTGNPQHVECEYSALPPGQEHLVLTRLLKYLPIDKLTRLPPRDLKVSIHELQSLGKIVLLSCLEPPILIIELSLLSVCLIIIHFLYLPRSQQQSLAEDDKELVGLFLVDVRVGFEDQGRGDRQQLTMCGGGEMARQFVEIRALSEQIWQCARDC